VLTIIEGPDGAGKTELVHGLRARGYASAEVINHGAYLGRPTVAELYLYSLRRSGPQRSVIMDRAWQAEPIYGQVMRDGEDRVGAARRRMLERIALSKRVIVVYCLPPIERCVAAWRSRRHEEYPQREGQLRRIYDLYERARTREVLPYLVYDYTLHDVDTLIKAIDELRPISNGGPGIGAWRPGEVALLVGDTTNAYTQELRGYPFVSFHGGGCSGWLAQTLEDAHVPESSLYWINSTTYHGAPTSTLFVERLRPKVVIALGGNARRWCDEHDVSARHTFDWVNHPQHHKRFHHRRTYDLVTVLRRHL
jgi:hypothetical protein